MTSTWVDRPDVEWASLACPYNWSWKAAPSCKDLRKACD